MMESSHEQRAWKDLKSSNFYLCLRMSILPSKASWADRIIALQVRSSLIRPFSTFVSDRAFQRAVCLRGSCGIWNPDSSSPYCSTTPLCPHMQANIFGCTSPLFCLPHVIFSHLFTFNIWQGGNAKVTKEYNEYPYEKSLLALTKSYNINSSG